MGRKEEIEQAPNTDRQTREIGARVRVGGGEGGEEEGQEDFSLTPHS